MAKSVPIAINSPQFVLLFICDYFTLALTWRNMDYCTLALKRVHDRARKYGTVPKYASHLGKNHVKISNQPLILRSSVSGRLMEGFIH